jgi:UDP-4-amino-4-deoxy-L-arabinose formyltransferase/UDP-glucuronic acid dehydrogenase (UDP-4-keto-hexauronic acid decarboxylating)
MREQPLTFDVGGGAVVIGCRHNTLEFIESLLAHARPVAGLITLERAAATVAQVPTWVDLRAHFGQRLSVYEARSYRLSDPADQAALGAFTADVGFCIGWQRLLPDWLLGRLRNGVFGMHCCQFPLPRGRGRSPINWGLIEGAETLQAHIFRYNDVPDSGEILSITPIPITGFDTIHTVQQKARVVFSREAMRHWETLTAGVPELFPIQQDEPDLEYPKRTPDDGAIDWRWPVRRIADWVRAQTHPYPGAFCVYRSSRARIWRCPAFGLAPPRPLLPGTIGERFFDSSLVVQAGDGWVHLVEHELPPTVAIGDRLQCP